MGILRDRIDAEKAGRDTSPAELIKQSRQQPDMETLQEWMDDCGCEAVDCGCWVEHDGHCPCGNESWFLRLGLI